jgi:hypothetical protein
MSIIQPLKHEEQTKIVVKYKWSATYLKLSTIIFAITGEESKLLVFLQVDKTATYEGE